MADEKKPEMGICKGCGASLPEEYLSKHHGLCAICYAQQNDKRDNS